MPWKKSEPMEQKREFCVKALGGGNFRALCKAYGISAKTGYKWKERFEAEGLAGMEDQSRRPHGSPEQLKEKEVCEIVRLKMAHPYWGPRKIQALYRRQHGQAASESSFKRVLEKAGLTQARKRRQATESGRLSEGLKGQAANEVWTVDFKGWWYNAQNKRCEPLTIRDEYSRFILELRGLENARSQTVRSCFEKVFERYGLPQAIRSDNGTPFASEAVYGLSRLSAWWVALGINLERGRPAHPQDNGGHERLHRDVSNELESLRESTQEAFDLWVQEFNYERPHEALGMRCPGEIYQPSQSRYEGTPEELIYASMLTRRVNSIGRISWEAQSLFITGSLAGWTLGLKKLGNGLIEVWFAQLLLGHIDPRTVSFLRADIRPKATRRAGAGRNNFHFSGRPPGSLQKGNFH
jgi:putative transposase